MRDERTRGVSQRATELAAQFDVTVDELIAVVSDCTDQEWFATSSDGGWTVAFESYHIAFGMQFEHRWIKTLTDGGQIEPLSLEAINEANDRDALEYARVSKDLALDALDRNRRLVRDHIANLSDIQLDLSFPHSSIFLGASADKSVTVETLIDVVYIGHVRNHLDHIRRRVGKG